MKRELHRFEYTCDGYGLDGRKCGEHVIVTAYDADQADAYLADSPCDWTGFVWVLGAQGWLCPNWVHRNDPRARSAP